MLAACFATWPHALCWPITTRRSCICSYKIYCCFADLATCSVQVDQPLRVPSKKAKKLKQKAKKQQKRHATVDTSEAVSADQSGETAETSSLDDLTLDSLADTAMQVPCVGLYTTPRESSSRKAGLPGQLLQMQGASLPEQKASCSMNGTSEDANGQQAAAAANDIAKAERSLSLGALFCCPITQVHCIVSSCLAVLWCTLNAPSKY